MDAQTLVAQTRAAVSSASPAFITTVISNVAVRVMLHAGRPWMVLQDVLKLLGYKKPRRSDLGLVFLSHRKNIDDFTLTLPFGKRGLSIIDEAGLHLVCEFVKQHRSAVLARWLEDGGISAIAAKFGQQQDVATTTQPPEVVPILGKNELEFTNDAPVVYLLMPADFNGTPVTLVPYGEKMGMVTDQVAMLLRDEQHDVREIMALIDTLIGADTEDMTALVRIGGLGTVRVLDNRAVRRIDCHLGTEKSEALADWFEAKLDQILAVTSLVSEGETDEEPPEPAPPVADSLRDLEEAQNDAYSIYQKVRAQLRAIKRIAEEDGFSTPLLGEVFDLAETAESLADRLEGLTDELDKIKTDLRLRLLRQPGEGDCVPDFVWLGVIEELSAERERWDSEDMWRLCQHATALDKHAQFTPEAGAAVACVKAFAHRQGALIYSHEPSGTLSHAWLAGHDPRERQRQPEAR